MLGVGKGAFLAGFAMLGLLIPLGAVSIPRGFWDLGHWGLRTRRVIIICSQHKALGVWVSDCLGVCL